MTGVQAHAKWLKKQIKDGAGPSTDMASYRPQVAKAVVAACKKSIANLMCKVTVPAEHETLRDEIFNPQG